MKLRYIAVLIFLCVSLGLAQEIKFQDVVLNNGGFPFPTIRVCTEPASGTPCTPLATGIFSDPGGTQPLSNPFTGDATGNFTFYGSATAVYHVQVSGVGIQTYDIPYIVLPSGSGSTAQCIATVATLTSKCGTIPGTIASAKDAVNLFDCSIGLGGSTAACIYNGVAWVPISQNVCSAYVLQVGGTGLTCGDTVNFNSTTPGAPTNGLNVIWAKSTALGIDSVSGAIVGDANAAHCLSGTGTWVNCSGGSGGGNPILENCTPDQTGNSFYNVAGLANFFYGAWQFVFNTTTYINCTVFVPTAQTGATFVLDVATSDSTAGHTANLQTCDQVINSGTVNIGALSCAANQTFTTTSTAYNRVSLTFNVQSTLANNSILVVKIGISPTGTAPTANLIVYPHFIL